MLVIPIDLYTPEVAATGLFEGVIDGKAVRVPVSGVKLDQGAQTATLYETQEEVPAIEEPPLPPQWLLLYAQLLTSGVFQVVRQAIATGTDNALGAGYTDFIAALQNGEKLEEILPGAGLAPFQVCLNNLTALVPLTDELLLELRDLLDNNGFGAIASPLPPPPPEPEPGP